MNYLSLAMQLNGWARLVILKLPALAMPGNLLPRWRGAWGSPMTALFVKAHESHLGLIYEQPRH